MAETSFPLVEAPMSAHQWKQVTLGIGDGILDQGGYPYKLDSFDNATNTAMVRVGANGEAAAILKGFYHRIDEDVQISLPAQTSRRTLYVVLEYDPARASTNPVMLKVVTSLDTTGGRSLLHLWNVTRNANELLTDAAVRMIRPRVAPTSTYAYESDLPQANKVLWGTVAFVHSGRATDDAKIFMSMNDDAGTWYWKTIYDPSREPDWVLLPDTANAQNGASGYKKALQRRGPTRKMRGRFNRGAVGSNYNAASSEGYLVTSLAAGDVPAASTYQWVWGGSGGVLCYVEVSRVNSEVRLYVVSGSCSYVDLGVIEWTV